MFRTPLERLRALGWLEGVSFLLLLGVAMPLKYLAGLPAAVRIVGLAHGILFLGYVVAIAETALAHRWPARLVLGALFAAVVPFGPFVLDARLRQRAEATREDDPADTPGRRSAA